VACSVGERPSCAVLIPAYNEAETVADVVRVAKEAGLGPVVVIDDGSDDDTAAAAEAAGAEVLRLSENRTRAARSTRAPQIGPRTWSCSWTPTSSG
jgi:glycosyltransferase involved in cell wall biosynthesis